MSCHRQKWLKSGEEEFCLHQYNNNVAKIAYTVSGPPAPCILSLCPLYPVPMPPVSCPHAPCILPPCPLYPVPITPVSCPCSLSLYPVFMLSCILSLYPAVSCPYAPLYPVPMPIFSPQFPWPEALALHYLLHCPE